MGTLKKREWKHRENVWITKASDSLCPQVDTNTDIDDADEMEGVSAAAAAAAAAPTAVDGNSATVQPVISFD